MKKTNKMLAALMSAVMLGTVSAVPDTAYSEKDTSVPFTVTIDTPNLTEGYFAVIFKNDYSRETVENVLIPELKGNSVVKDIRFFKTYYNADNFYTTDTSAYKVDYISRDVYIVELESDDKETAYAAETSFNETGYFHYIDAVNFFGTASAFNSYDDEVIPFTAKPKDNFIANKLVVMFKGKYSKEEIEGIVIPELKGINGVKDFRYMSTGEKGRAMYMIDLDFEREDKESAYDTAKALYDTGYFYSVEMNMLPNTASDNVKGDANCDGNVDMSDAVLIMQTIANPSKYKLTEEGRSNADMDGDGITSGDALAIQKKLLGLDKPAEIKFSKTIDWYSNNVPSGVYDICRGNGRSAVITNTDELKEYIVQVAPQDKTALYIEKYNDSFFDENVLLINSVNQGAGASVGYEFGSIDFLDKEINIGLKSTLKQGEPAAAVMSLCIAQITVPKTAYFGQTVNWTI